MGVQIPSGGPKNKKHPLRCFLFLYTKEKRDLKPTVKKTVRWTVFREERWWYYNWEQAVIYEAESKRIRKSTSGGPKNKKHPLRCFLFLYTKKKRDLKPTVKKTVRWTVFREERWWYYNWEQAVIYEAESKRIRKSTSGGPKNKKHPLRCFLFLYTKKAKGFEADR